jgi:putative transposase
MRSARILQTGEKNGSKRHILVDGHGIPLSLIVTGANRHDVSQLSALLDGPVIQSPQEKNLFLYADKGYSGKPAQEQIRSRGYTPRVTQKIRGRCRPPKNRRWVVEGTHSWFNRFRKLLVRHEKLVESYEALVCLAAAIICWGKVGIIYG